MRDTHDGMPEIIDAFGKDDQYFGIIEIVIGGVSKKFQFGISQNGYRELRKLLQLRPFDSMPGVTNRYFFANTYGKLPDSSNYRSYFRVEQGRDAKKVEIIVPKNLLANLVWFSQIKDFGEAEHLPVIKEAR